MSRDISSSDPVGVADDSVAAEQVYGSSASGGNRGAKVCCKCGRDVAGQKRFKDGDGRYWCPDCADEDEQRKHPIPCADCQKDCIKKELTAHEGRELCAACLDKRVKVAKRIAARVAAADEEGRRQHAQRRVWAISFITAVAVLALFGLVWVLFF